MAQTIAVKPDAAAQERANEIFHAAMADFAEYQAVYVAMAKMLTAYAVANNLRFDEVVEAFVRTGREYHAAYLSRAAH